MTDTVEMLLARLQSERDKTADFFSALTAEQWNSPVYGGPPAWTAREILAHIVSAEGEFLRLFRDVQIGGAGAPLGFFADEFNAAEQDRFRGQSSQELLSEFLHRRAEMMNWVGSLSAADLEKTGRHPVLGDIPLWEMIKALTLHAHLHFRDIRRSFDVA
jgi:uncharacterized damage-inducible protein DinB